MSDINAALYRELGELIASVRDLKHSVNNANQKIDAVAVLTSTVDRLVKDHEKLRTDVEELKDAEERRKGAIGLVEWLSRHWPVTIIIAALMVFWAWFSGKPL